MTTSSLFSRLMRPFSSSGGSLRVVENGSGGGAASADGAKYETATVAAGCFWGVEHKYRKTFGGGKGVVDAKVGYTGGETEGPSYRAVCGGRTGHAEALRLTFDPSLTSYRTLLEYFYKIHDPTTMNAQGPDTGPQYRSAIFYHSPEQEKIARDVTERANREWWNGKIVTEILPAGKWWDAETYHQLYLDKNPGGYECPTHFDRRLAPLSRPEGEGKL
ncbi:peptide methionine sulfoxide reductase MsrA [Phyllosticta capitalensis]|uniref:putative peptide methionine sulfoxide reductase n=1 Tax=Phyllosticta capitalensis TaxID=121624 RepID=UPI0031304108